jgi:hypothetical protein
MQFAAYATFEQMHGRKASLEELAERLKPYSRESVLYVCATIGMILKLWNRADWERTHYELLLTAFFDPLRGDWYKLSARNRDPELVFHRRQLLLIMKLAIEYCTLRGHDLLDTPAGYFGTILLMANDQFHYELYPFAEGTDEREKVLRVLAEFVPVNEYAGWRIENRLIRSHLMMTKYTDRLSDHPDFVSIASAYEELAGISLEEHEVLTFAVFARCDRVTLDGLQKNAWLAALREENFHATAILRETIHRFFSELAARPAEIKAEIEGARNRNREYGTNDFTVFRKKPLVTESYGMLPSDIMFIIDKFETGPYWRVNDINRETGDKLRRFWGSVFEAYANDQLWSAAERSGARFLLDPRWAGDANTQVCDSILVEDDALVLLEYKANMFTARAKYSGDHLLLLDEIVKKLVWEEDTGKKKGVRQLADAVARLLKDDAVQGVDLSKIRRIYPLLVTLDDLGATVLMSCLLNGYFAEYLAGQGLSKEKVQPMFCTDIESLVFATSKFSTGANYRSCWSRCRRRVSLSAAKILDL